MSKHTLAALIASASPAAAQVINGDFETGQFTPWVITNTPGGGTIGSQVAIYDIDGFGPLPFSKAALFIVGRNTPGATPEGIILSQPISLTANTTYRIRLNYSAHAIINVYNATAGIFELLIDGAVVDSATTPNTTQGSYAYGVLAADFAAPQSRPYTLGIRITRPVLRGEEVLQYIDNVSVSIACYANCDGSTVQPVLTANDFQCFINAYASASPAANCDGSTQPPVLTANDFQCFINAYASGCS